MKTIGRMAVGLACLCLVGQASAALNINEIYISHAGTDDREFIELIGTPGLNMSAFSVLVIEGDGGAQGTVDRVYPLAGKTMPGDGYFVIGDTAVSNVDMIVGATNTLENGTNTFLLVENLVAGIVAGTTDVDADNDGVEDPAFANIGTIADLIGVIDTGIAGLIDATYYGASNLGPDGTFLPAGVFRPFDYPNPWADGKWLDFDPDINLNFPRTPGAANVPEPATLGLLAMGGLALLRRRK